MANTISPQNFVCDRFINNIPKVVVLEDMFLVREVFQQFIENELGWQVIIAENRNEAVKLCESQGAEFYILDIKLGTEKERSQEGLDTAEIVRQIDKSVFVSIFSGVPNLELYKKIANRIGVNHFEEKGNVLQEGVARIAVEMLLFQKQSLDNTLQKYLHSSAYLGNDEILRIVSKIKEVNNKLEDIQKLERIYQFDSTDHLTLDKLKLDPKLLFIEEDKNIQHYESLKQNSEWREKYQNQYVAFADGEWLENFVADNSKDLLNQLRDSEHKGKSIFYKKVPKNNIVDTQESDKFIEEEEFYELPISFYDFYVSEDEN